MSGNLENKITRAQIVETVRNLWTLNGVAGVEEHLGLIQPLLDMFENVMSEADKQKFISCFSETTDAKEALTNYLFSMGATNVTITIPDQAVQIQDQNQGQIQDQNQGQIQDQNHGQNQDSDQSKGETG